MRRFYEKDNADYLDELYDRGFDMSKSFFDDATDALFKLAKKYSRKRYVNVENILEDLRDNIDLLVDMIEDYLEN